MKNAKLKENLKDFLIFPSNISYFHYTCLKDLSMTSKYISFSNTITPIANYNLYNTELNMEKFLIENLSDLESTIIIDMTGNIGCDSANFAYTLPNQIIFTCEINYDKIYCLNENLKIFKNNFIFYGNSIDLLEATLNKNISTIKSMFSKIQSQKEDLLNDILNEFDKYRIIILIDPPFGPFYHKDGSSTKLEFSKNEVTYEILNYFNIINDKFNSKIFKYIIKCPVNWDRLQEFKSEGMDFNDNDNIKLIYAPTLKSGYYYVIINPTFFKYFKQFKNY